MFKDTKEGTTHFENDGCGEPEHNKALKEHVWMEEFTKLCGGAYCAGYTEPLKEFIEKLLDKQREELNEFWHKNRAPMGVSQWRNHGIAYGYDKFFNIEWPNE